MAGEPVKRPRNANLPAIARHGKPLTKISAQCAKGKCAVCYSASCAHGCHRSGH